MSLVSLRLLSRNFRKAVKVQSYVAHRNLASTSIDPEKGYQVLKKRKRVNILDSYMSYLDTEVGDDIVLFLHGNPTSSYLWRNIIPHVEPIARCLAPDLIGMGLSGKLKNSQYRFVDQYKYLSAWIDEMKFPKKINLVVQDWGSALGFHWSNMNRDCIASISYFEAIIKPFKDWLDFPELAREEFQILRTSQGKFV